MYCFNVKVSCQIFGSEEAGIEPIHFNCNSETLTVRALIARTVEKQVQLLLKTPAELAAKSDPQQIFQRQYLAETDVVDMAKLGVIRVPESINDGELKSQLDVEQEIKRAQEAFRKQNFLITINGSQPDSLDEKVTLTDHTSVLFLRLMPLVGG